MIFKINKLGNNKHIKIAKCYQDREVGPEIKNALLGIKASNFFNLKCTTNCQ